MEKETIKDLYYGKIRPAEMEPVEREEYLAHSESLMKMFEEFGEKLPEKLKEEWRTLMDEEMKAAELLHRDGFCKGFSLGLRMTFESLMK